MESDFCVRVAQQMDTDEKIENPDASWNGFLSAN
jgi:hypothetical protein